MSHLKTLFLFKNIFLLDDEILEWFPNGKDSIRIRLHDIGILPFSISKKEDLIFTAKSRTQWKLETVDSWINSKKIINH